MISLIETAAASAKASELKKKSKSVELRSTRAVSEKVAKPEMKFLSYVVPIRSSDVVVVVVVQVVDQVQ